MTDPRPILGYATPGEIRPAGQRVDGMIAGFASLQAIAGLVVLIAFLSAGQGGPLPLFFLGYVIDSVAAVVGAFRFSGKRYLFYFVSAAGFIGVAMATAVSILARWSDDDREFHLFQTTLFLLIVHPAVLLMGIRMIRRGVGGRFNNCG